MIDKNFCLSSYIAYRYIYKDDVDFFCGINHKNINYRNENNLIRISTWKDIHDTISDIIINMYKQYKRPAILLSGGMDSAIVASYLKPDTLAYTFSSSDTGIFNEDVKRAKNYCEKFHFIHKIINISFDDYKKLTPPLMKRKGSPIHSIEPQIYKAALQAKKDGADILLIGDAADYFFGGMDKLLSREWDFESFLKRYYTVNPEDVLVNPVDVSDLLRPYDEGGFVNVEKVLNEPAFIESINSYDNAIKLADIPYLDPYEFMVMAEKLDLKKIRNGESKYLIRQLYKERYPDMVIPEKIPMPRPVDYIFSNWKGPKRKEFRKDIDMSKLSGNQKWQLWCSELFLNLFESN